MGLGWTMADYVNRPSCIYPESGHGPASLDRSLLLIIGKVGTVLSFYMCIADTFGRFWTLLFKREMEGEGGDPAGGEGLGVNDTPVFLLNEYIVELNPDNFNILNQILN